MILNHGLQDWSDSMGNWANRQPLWRALFAPQTAFAPGICASKPARPSHRMTLNLMMILWRGLRPLDLEGVTMSNLESRIAKLEAVQEASGREYSDMELAVRIAYLLETGGPDADKVRALLDKVPGDDHDKP